jgi:hypothetical protein
MPTNLGTTSPLPFKLGEGTSFGGLSLVPLFASAPPGLHFIGLDQAMAGGLAVSEVDEAGMVSGLSVSNLLDLDVLLFEGEELVGAKQNRILDRTILVAAISKTQVPVSCVERGRWSYRSRQFATAPRAAYPELRRMKREGGGQAQVWSELSEKASRLDARSDTDAAEQIYVSRSASLDEYLASLPLTEGQCGSIACIGGRVVCVDYAGSPAVYARLHEKLVRGYALDAIERPVAAEVATEELTRLLDAITSAARTPTPVVGRGQSWHLESQWLVGSELLVDGELVALSAFPRIAA